MKESSRIYISILFFIYSVTGRTDTKSNSEYSDMAGKFNATFIPDRNYWKTADLTIRYLKYIN